MQPSTCGDGIYLIGGGVGIIVHALWREKPIDGDT